jgi:hypothetical protein
MTQKITMLLERINELEGQSGKLRHSVSDKTEENCEQNKRILSLEE